ncbi:MAG: hypothetical protein ABJA16_02225 [Nakamurella sp.]
MLLTPTTTLWVWRPADPDRLLSVARTYRVGRLLIWVSPGFSSDRAEMIRLTSLRDAAVARGIRMDALSGDDSWVEKPEVAAGWAAEVRRSGLFDRLHVDVEPHGRADWGTVGPALRAGMLDMLAEVVAVGLPVDLDIPFWYDRFNTSTGDRFDRALMRLAAGVTVMAYRNNAAAVLDIATTALTAADGIGIPAWIGINTGETGGEPPSTSYKGSTGTHIRSEIALLDSGGTRWSSYAGVAVHHFASLPEATSAD